MPLVPEFMASPSSPSEAPMEIQCPDPLDLEPPTKRVLTVQEYFTRDHSMCPVLPHNVSTQTRCQDLSPLPPFAFPEVP